MWWPSGTSKFFNPIQPVVYQRLKHRLLFDRQEMIGAIQHGEGCARVAFKHSPGVSVPNRDILPPKQEQARRATQHLRAVDIKGERICSQVSGNTVKQLSVCSLLCRVNGCAQL